MIILRKILFYIFLGIYLVLCPLVILYSLGYIYAPKTEDKIVKTGLIRLETLPAGANVRLNQRPLEIKTPCSIGELFSGIYQIQIELQDYRPWSQAIHVEAGKAEVFDRILLIPERFRTEILISQSFEKMVRVPATRYLLLFSGPKIRDVTVFDWKSASHRKLVAPNSVYSENIVRRYFLASESPFVLLETQGAKGNAYLWCELKEDAAEVVEVSALFKEGSPEQAMWGEGRPEYLFALYGDRLARISLDKRKVQRDFMTGLKGFGIWKGKVYGLKDDRLVRVPFNAKESQATLADRGHFLAELFPDPLRVRMDFFSDEAVLFMGGQGELLTNLLPYRLVAEGVSDYVPDENFKSALVWKRAELGFLNIRKEVKDRVFFERGLEIDWFLRGRKDIRQAYFVYKSSHAVFCDGDTVFLSEISGPGPWIQQITKVRDGSVPFYSEKNGKLYYLEPQRGYLVALDILPEEWILPVRITESVPSKEEANP